MLANLSVAPFAQKVGVVGALSFIDAPGVFSQ
jgi:hypothetical protein